MWSGTTTRYPPRKPRTNSRQVNDQVGFPVYQEQRFSVPFVQVVITMPLEFQLMRAEGIQRSPSGRIGHDKVGKGAGLGAQVSSWATVFFWAEYAFLVVKC